MQASVWKLAPTSAARAASSGIGSTTPCGYCGALPTTSTVLGPTWRGHGVDVGAPVVAHGHLVHSQAEVVGGLVEGGVGTGRHHHLRLGDAPLLAAALAGGLHRAEDALGAAGGHEAGDVVVAVQEVGGDADDIALDAAQARERLGVEGVVVEEHLGDLLHHRVHLGSRVVDHPEGLAVLPAHVAGAQLGEGVARSRPGSSPSAAAARATR